jgi:hypothetical protein
MNFARHQSDYMVTLHDRIRVLEDQHTINDEYFTTLSDEFLSFLKNLDVSGQDTNILIGDNSSQSFSIVEGETPYLTFDTTNSNEKIICSKPLINTNTTQSTSKDTGCLILEGGIGVEKNGNIGGSLTVTGGTTLNGGLIMDTDKFTVADSTGNTSIGGTLEVSGATTFYSTTQSSSISTGSIVTSGGLGVAKNAYFGGSVVEKYTAYSGLVNSQTITINLAAGNNIHLSFSSGGSKTITINNPINASSVIGQSGFIIVDLNGTNNTIQWDSDWKFKTSPVTSSTATFDVIKYYVFSSTRILCNYETDVNSVYFFLS